MHGQSIMPTYEMEEHVIAAAQHILKAIGASKNLSDDLRNVLEDINSRLSSLNATGECKGCRLTQIEEPLRCAEEKILHWKSNPSPIWDSGPAEATEYLQAVDEILRGIESVRGLSTSENRRAREMVFQAEHVLQIAMSRLEEELCHILTQHKQFFEPQDMSFHLPAENVIYDKSFTSSEGEIVEEILRRDRGDRESIEYTLDLVNPHVIPDIKSIANVMSACSYSQEFHEAFIGLRREAFNEYLSILDMEKFSLEDVLKLEWGSLDSEIKKWMSVMKIIVPGYLASEKRLCDQILGNYTAASSYCFMEISKASILFLLNFGQAVAMGHHNPEKLSRLLDMYELLNKIHLEIDVLFSVDNGSFIRIEFHELLSRLGDSTREIFSKFRNAILCDASLQPFNGGGVHHLTRYAMNYMVLLSEYRDTINLLLKDHFVDDSDVVHIDDWLDISSSSIICPIARLLRSFTSALESNLIDKSRLYKDDSLQHVFLINNFHYMVQKVKDSDLRHFFGDEWIRKYSGKVQQHATSYVRPTWSSVVSILRDDRKMTLKERCRKFSNAFEEIYKIQTCWHIQDPRLREDLQIKISQNVIPAYRNFLGPNNSKVSDKYVKYTAEDLEKLLLYFFVGSSPRNSRRK